MANKPIEMAEFLKDAPKNWGRWGADDEIGSLNFLTSAEVLRGVRAVKQGKVFMLGVPVGRPEGDPLHPIRSQPIRTQTMDEGFYISGRAKPFPGGLKYSDDVIVMFPQGTSTMRSATRGTAKSSTTATTQRPPSAACKSARSSRSRSTA